MIYRFAIIIVSIAEISLFRTSKSRVSGVSKLRIIDTESGLNARFDNHARGVLVNIITK